MYNGGYNGGGYNGDSNYSSVFGFRIRSMYLYIAVAVVVILAIYFVVRFLNTGLVMHFGMFAGVLLLLANVRELIGQPYAQRSNTALLNSLVGGALIFAWLSQILSAFMWIPAILLIGVATPLAFGRASVYTMYVQTARNAMDGLRRAVGR